MAKRDSGARAAGPRADADRVVGVLAIQGDVEKHLSAIERCGARGRRVRMPADLAGLSALILPGGESTTISKGLDRHALIEPIRAFAQAGGALLGTCAGAILLARAARSLVQEGHPVATLGLVDLDALRNAYGTQVDSFVAPADADSGPEWQGMECVFIRAPRLVALGPEVEILARVDGEPVLVRQGRRLACTFHPELTDDLRVHAALLELAGSRPIG